MRTQEIADLLKGQLSGDGTREITGISDVKDAGPNDVAFVHGTRLEGKTRAGCLLVSADFVATDDTCLIRVESPKLAFAIAADSLISNDTRRSSIDPDSRIASTAKIGANVSVGAFVTIGENSVIGDGTSLLPGVFVGDNVNVGADCRIGANSSINDNCTLGDRVRLHAGVVIGSDGFGYVRGPDGHIKFPQVGTVVIENDVEIGANSCIDRGALGETRIGKGTKIDNLVQIAHNVRIGERVLIAALAGISGSVVIEDDVTIAGQVGIGEHATIRSGAILAGRAGVFSKKIVRSGAWGGTPVQPLDSYMRQTALLRQLERLIQEIRQSKPASE